MSASHEPNFDPVARIYRWAEYILLGPFLQRARTYFLDQLPTLRHALVLGDGDGRFLASLLHRQTALHAISIDTSQKMLSLLSHRCRSEASRVQTLHTSALTFTPSDDTDLIATHFFLDCLTQMELDSLTRNFSAHLRPGTLWLLSDFGQPAPRLLRPFAAIYIRTLYIAFRILTGLRVRHLPDPQTSLKNAGFECLGRRSICFGFIYAEMWRKKD